MKMFKTTMPQLKAISRIYKDLYDDYEDLYKESSPKDKDNHIFKDFKKLTPMYKYYIKNKMKGELWVESKEQEK